MKPFDLQKAKEGRPVCIQGVSALILGKYMFTYQNEKREYHIFKFGEQEAEFCADCEIYGGSPVFRTVWGTPFVWRVGMAPVKKQVWMNIYMATGPHGESTPVLGYIEYPTEEQAKRAAQPSISSSFGQAKYSRTALIHEWEE